MQHLDTTNNIQSKIKLRPQHGLVSGRRVVASLLLTLVLLFTVWLRPTRTYASLLTFDAYRNFGTGLDNTRSAASGDVDGDGDLDIVTGNNGGQNAVYLNDGTGNYPAGDARNFGPGNDSTFSVAVGDVDGDGDLDIIAGNHGQQNTIYLNDGTGTFPASGARDFGPGDDSTFSVAVGDVDGDGQLDIVAGNNGQLNVVYLREANGDIDAGHPFGNVSDYTRSVAIGDLDGDGHLDIATGNGEDEIGQQSVIYLNNGDGGFPIGDARIFGLATGIARSVAVGDMNGDDHLDIVVGDKGGQNAVYLNDGNGSFGTVRNFGSGDDLTLSVTVGDIDSDGDLDIVSGNTGTLGGPNVLFLNDGEGQFYTSAVDCGVPPENALCFGSGHDFTQSLALGDADSDGDLDIITGNGGTSGRQNVVYLNNGSGSFPGSDAGSFGSTEIANDQTLSLALGDVDDDGDLDIVSIDDGGQDMVYLNDGTGSFYAGPLSCQDLGHVRCFGNGHDPTQEVAIGDVDGDDDLDIITVSDAGLNAVYLNDEYEGFAGRFDWPGSSHSFGAVGDSALGVALGDVDGDGDLDIVTGDHGGQNAVHLNDGTGGFDSSSGFGTGEDDTLSVALGDVDGDAYLDIVAGNDGQNMVYLNDGTGTFHASSVDCSAPPAAARCVGSEEHQTQSVAVGDMDGDNDLDIVLGNDGETNAVYLNDGAGSFDWSGNVRGFGSGLDATHGVAVGDMDGDGDLDIVAGNKDEPNAVHLNDGTGHFPDLSSRTFSTSDDTTLGVALGDMDRDGDLDVVIANLDQMNRVEENHVTGADRLDNNPPGVALTRPGPTANADHYSTPQILGERFIPIPYTPHDRDGDPVGRIAGYYSLNGGGHWYTATATVDTPTSNLTTVLFPTSTLTFTHVFTWDTFASGVFGQSDNVVVRLEAYPQPVHTTITSTYLYTKTVPGPYQRPFASGMTFPFRVRGTQIRVLSGTEPISNAMVYRLPEGQPTGGTVIADGAGQPYRTDPLGYMQGRGTVFISDTLVAMLPITWTESYTVHYTNATPTPIGLEAYTVSGPGVQTLTVSSDKTLILYNLDVSLEWDARSDEQFMSQLLFDLQRTSEILYDWTNGQAALGQVTVYHDREEWLDAHIRIYASNRIRPSAMQGGIVSAVITDPVTSTLNYLPGQIHIGAIWNRFGEPDGALSEDWPRALAHELGHYALYLDDNYLGLDTDRLLLPVETCPGAMSDPYRVDDASGYDEFHHGDRWDEDCGDTLASQSSGRWDWQTITTFYPQMNGVITNTGPSGLPLAVTQIEVIEPDAPTTTLEVPIFYLTQDGGRVQPGVRARAFLYQEDRLTDLGRPTLDQVHARGARPDDRICVYELTAGRLGCETVTPGDEQMALVAVSDWEPDVIVSPITSRTIVITVTNVPTGLSLNARVFPVIEPAPPGIALAPGGDAYSATISLDEPTLVGYVQVWVDEPEPRREIVTDYTLGGNPGLMRGNRGLMRGSRGLMRGSRAPAVSADGQVILYGENLNFEDGEFYTLQTATTLPAAPPWATSIGQAFRLSTSASAPDLEGTSITFSYLGSEVPPGEEDWLRVYYWQDDVWQRLPTRLDTYYNIASAATQGEGLYALMSSIEIPLHGPGWDSFSYPVSGTRPVTEALQPIEGYYSVVYGYVVTDTADPWKVYSPDAPDWVNDLKVLRFGHAYWIYVTETITLPLKGGYAQGSRTLNTMPVPPATYYGAVSVDASFTPTVGMTVTARIANNLCGRSQTIEIDDQIVYVIDVFAEDFNGAAGCGALGRSVTLFVESELMAPSVPWDNRRVAETPLRRVRVYLPLMLKVF